MTKTDNAKPDAADEGATTDKDPTAGELLALAFLLIGPLVLLGQAVYWLIYRVWFPLPVSRLLEWLHIPATGFGSGSVGEKAEMVLGAPTSIVLFVLAVIICLSVFQSSGEDSETNENNTGESRRRIRLAKLMKLRRKSKET